MENPLMENSTELIGGLPTDLAYQCLLRVPVQFHSKLRSVCKYWRMTLGNPQFYRDRKEMQLLSRWIVIITPRRKLKNSELSDFTFQSEPSEDLPTWDQLHLHVYDTVACKWLHGAAPVPPEINTNFNGFGAVTLGGKLLIYGGDNSFAQNTCWSWDLVTNIWRKQASLTTARSYMASGSFGGLLYVIGGWADNELDSCESFNIQEDRWQELPPMKEPHTFHHHRDVVINGRIYAGRVADGNVVIHPLPGSSCMTSGVEGNEGDDDEWSRAILAIPGDKAWLDGRLYGLVRHRSTLLVKLFRPATRKWHAVAALAPDIAGSIGPALLAPLDNELYVVGKRNLSLWKVDLVAILTDEAKAEVFPLRPVCDGVFEPDDVFGCDWRVAGVVM